MSDANTTTSSDFNRFGVKLEQLTSSINVLVAAAESDNLTESDLRVFLHALQDQAEDLMERLPNIS
ncbi:hypothetical protein ACKVEX_05550 [Rhodocyclaceae bacterium SMB388]